MACRSTVLVLQLVFVWNCYATSDLPGHLQPLGSHRPPEYVRRVSVLPSPLEFHDEYVSSKTPLLMEGIMKNAEVIKNWQNDDYLRSEFGEFEISVEQGKKENRSEYAFVTTFHDFLERYKTENIYMVSNPPAPMLAEWQLPRFLQCGGYMDHMMYVNMWFSSGGTKSVLHSDSYENLHCLVSGRKEFILIEPHYSELIGPEHQVKGYYDIDVDRVDMTVYPNLAKVPWYNVTVNEGDCLYLPYQWLHNVNSFGRNMGINLWWSGAMVFNTSSCLNTDELHDFIPFGDMELNPELQIREGLSPLAQEDGTIHVEDVQKLFDNHDSYSGLTVEHFKKMLDILEPGCDGVLHNLKSVPNSRLKEAMDYISTTINELLDEQVREMGGFYEGEDYSEEFGGHGFDSSPHDETGHVTDEDDHMTEGGGDYEHWKDEL